MYAVAFVVITFIASLTPETGLFIPLLCLAAWWPRRKLVSALVFVSSGAGIFVSRLWGRAAGIEYPVWAPVTSNETLAVLIIAGIALLVMCIYKAMRDGVMPRQFEPMALMYLVALITVGILDNVLFLLAGWVIALGGYYAHRTKNTDAAEHWRADTR